MLSELFELDFELFPYSLDLGSFGFFLFSDFERKLDRRKFANNDEITTKTEAYFESNDKGTTKMLS